MMGIRQLAWATAACLLAAGVSAKGAIGIKGAKLAVSSPDGLNDATYSLKEPAPLSKTIALEEGSTLKLTFGVVDTVSGEPVFPQQALLLFEDQRGDDVRLPVTVKSNGKASFTINMAKPPAALLSTQGRLDVTLLLSALDTVAPLSYTLGQISLPSSSLTAPPRGRHDLPPRQGEPAFKPQQELFHSFKQDEKTVSAFKSAIGTGLVIAPWGLLAILYAQISSQLEFKSPPLSAYLFVGSLAALEALIFTYWVGLKLYQFLPIFGPLSLVSAYLGMVSLRSLRQRRLKAGGCP